MLKEVSQDLPPMNRAQRKAWDKLKNSAAFKRMTLGQQAVALAQHGLPMLITDEMRESVGKLAMNALAPLRDSRPYEEHELVADFIKVQESYLRLRDGGADEADFNRVAVAINLAKVRALSIDEILANGIEKAQDAMMKCKARRQQHGRYGFDGQGLQAMAYAVEAHEEIVKLSSPKQMLDAMAVMHKALRIQSQHGQQLAQLLA